jgi:hypothetical protein
MTKHVCPHCRQPLINTRIGVRLSPIKARIFDSVRSAGEAGVSRATLEQMIYGRAVSEKNIKAHIQQINEMFAHTDWSIRSDRAGHYASYHLVRGPRSSNTHREIS